jgi:glycerol dehydrogenase-like iron-containing ADH family enzyme
MASSNKVDYWTVDYDGITKSFNKIDDFVVFSVEPPWSRCSKLFPHEPSSVHFASVLETEHLERVVNSIEKVPEFVVGLGGGTAIDSAKYFAIKTGAKFISIPTVLSVVAYFTPKAAVRSNGIVRFVGDKFPDRIVIDFPIIRSAPRNLNIAGIGDLYSASTGLLDWKLARDRLDEEYDTDTVQRSYDLIDYLRKNSSEICNLTDPGLRTMIEVGMNFFRLHRPYEIKNKLWPDQGVEHVFFYSLEKITGRSFIHGEIIGMGCVVGAYMHGENVDHVLSDLVSFGLRFRPKEVGVSRDEFARSVSSMRMVAKESNFRYLILDEFELKDSDIENLWQILNKI